MEALVGYRARVLYSKGQTTYPPSRWPALPRRRVGRPCVLLALTLSLTGIHCSKAPQPQLSRPNFARLDTEGNLLVADFGNNRVVRFDPSGKLLNTLGHKGIGRGQLWQIWGVKPLSDGRIAVVNHRLKSLDNQNSLYREVKVLSAKGRELMAFPARPAGETKVGWPQDLEIVPEGFAIADQERGSIMIFDEKGGYLRSIKEIQGGPPLIAPGAPRYREGSLWIAEYKAHRIRRISLQGEQLATFGSEGSGPENLLFPVSLDVAPDGSLAVADLGNYRVQRFRADGSHLGSITPPRASSNARVQVMDVAVDSAGRIYVTDSKGNRVLVYTTDGALIRIIDRWGDAKS